LKVKLYQDKEWLNHQYWNQGKSTTQIARLCNCNAETIRNWMKKFEIPRRTLKETTKGIKNPNYNNLKKNPSYFGVHSYIRRYKPKPEGCEICGSKSKLELSSKTHEYKRDVDEYRYLCRSCHELYDIQKGFR